MFEKFTEDARKTIFFARYEASQFGASEIDTEHLLLGILRADRNLARRLFPLRVTEEAVRTRITESRPVAEMTSTSVDLPISHSAKRALAHAAGEAVHLEDKHIGPEHLLLGIVHDESCLAGLILREAGFTLSSLRPTAPETVASSPGNPPKTQLPSSLFRDLTKAAEDGEPTPLIGRERELVRIERILSRRNKNNVAVIGEPGVGKTALLEGFAQRLAAGVIPDFSNRRVLLADALSFFPGKPHPKSQRPVDELFAAFGSDKTVVVCLEGLFDLVASGSDWGEIEAAHVLDPHLSSPGVRCIATGTPAGLRRTIENAPVLARHFEVINLAAPDPDEAANILHGLKSRYEQFHGVSYGDGTIEMAVYASGRFLVHRALPDRALDLLDEAGARVKVRRETEPPEVAAIRQRIRQHIRDMETAVVSHDLLAARQHSEAESAERENLRRLLEQRQSAESSNKTVTPADVEHVVADRIGVPVSTVRAILAQKGPAELEQTIRNLAAAISIDGNEWVALLAAYLVRSSNEDVEALAKAIRDQAIKVGRIP